MNTEITETNGGWILYDGDCAFCRRWVGRGYRLLRRRGFKFATLQSPWVAERFGLRPEELLIEMRLVLPDGRKLGGADALIEIARSIWWLRPLRAACDLPGARPMLRRAYRWIARNRACLGGACEIGDRRPKGLPDRGVTSAFFEWP